MKKLIKKFLIVFRNFYDIFRIILNVPNMYNLRYMNIRGLFFIRIIDFSSKIYWYFMLIMYSKIILC